LISLTFVSGERLRVAETNCWRLLAIRDLLKCNKKNQIKSREKILWFIPRVGSIFDHESKKRKKSKDSISGAMRMQRNSSSSSQSELFKNQSFSDGHRLSLDEADAKYLPDLVDFWNVDSQEAEPKKKHIWKRNSSQKPRPVVALKTCSFKDIESIMDPLYNCKLDCSIGKNEYAYVVRIMINTFTEFRNWIQRYGNL